MSTPQALSPEEYGKRLSKLKTVSDLNQFVKDLVGPTLQAMLEAEMTDHLGYEKHDPSGKNTGNSRNGSYPKTIKSSYGETTLEIPRDRNGSFEPVAVKKYETVEAGVEEKIVSMYAKGMTTRDIEGYMNEIYGISVSAQMISHITDKVVPLMHEWQQRPLASLYAVVYLDGIFFKVRDAGKIVNRCGYVAVGITGEGKRDILGIWLASTEGAKFWLSVLGEIKSRGCEDILIACMDGLKGFPEAVRAVFPQTDIQQCIVHQIRNTIKYIPHKERKRFCADLRPIYTAPTEDAGYAALQKVKELWPQYKLQLKSWEDKWKELSTFFAYSPPIRKIIYTTNMIENLNRQLRKVTKTTTIFPTDESLLKLLWLAQHDITKKWTMMTQNWGSILAELAILYPDRIRLE